MLTDDFLNGESTIRPVQGGTVIRDDFSTTWQVETAKPDGFHFKRMAFGSTKEYSVKYMSFFLFSPRRLDDLLSAPNIPKLYLNLETACCLRVWLNGKEIFTQETLSSKPVKMQTPLLLGKGPNHILIKVINLDTDYVVNAYLSSTHQDFIGQLDSFFDCC
jgi:beta-galactosidase